MPKFHLLIADWYRQNKRTLPWRETKNPYFIWLSEIVLQQTRVNQGLNYYYKFIENYPTVFDLAHADEQQVLADWQGLGYYSRARNLHATAREIAFQLDGKFPTSFSEIKKLKGIGDYTAAAIASFAFDAQHPVVDGNVFRVISRYLDVDTPIDSTQGKKVFDALAHELLGNHPAALHNQAIMEFGALQCVPVNPACDCCPLVASCAAFAHKTVSIRPVKQGKVKVRDRFFHYLHIEAADTLFLEKRVDKDIWQHLYQFPLLELERAMDDQAVRERLFELVGLQPVGVSKPIKHILSHQRIHARVWYFDQVPKASSIRETWIKIQTSDLPSYPIPRLLDRYLLEYVPLPIDGEFLKK